MPRFAMVIPMTRVEHLDPGSMAAYLEGRCDSEDRSRIEAHLAECSECCGELVALDQTIRTLPSRKRGRTVLPLLALGAAAAIGAFIVLRPGDRPAAHPRRHVHQQGRR